ncbi:MAG: hypothetical protein JSU72_05225 [Deltaproteobacteria bacterium]|nr:MAG: hypothetical protein JSU72_05225 [Deltaproteobacteria bacterium]
MNEIVVSSSYKKTAVVLISSVVNRAEQSFTFSELSHAMSKYRFLLYGERMRHCHSRDELRAGLRRAITELAREKHVRAVGESGEAYQVCDLPRLKRRFGTDPLVFPDNSEGHLQIAELLLFHNRKVTFLPGTKERMLQTFMSLFEPNQWSELKQRDSDLPWVL